MLSVNGRVIEPKHFPDGSQMMLDINIEPMGHSFNILWLYNSEEEIIRLMYLKKYIDEHFENVSVKLLMPYINSARMDRVKKECEVFTLKYFAEFINWLNFDGVYVLDAHSNVSLALINKVHRIDIKHCFGKLLGKECFQNTDLLLFFPDKGALDRYSEYFQEMPKLYGEKNRDWSTGKINGLKIFKDNGERIDDKDDKPLKNTTILMIDDIISYGGTFYHSAVKLQELGCDNIYAYATHTENSVLDEDKGTFLKCLNNNTVLKLFTTNSIYNGNHKNIEVLYHFG